MTKHVVLVVLVSTLTLLGPVRCVVEREHTDYTYEMNASADGNKRKL